MEVDRSRIRQNAGEPQVKLRVLANAATLTVAAFARMRVKVRKPSPRSGERGYADRNRIRQNAGEPQVKLRVLANAATLTVTAFARMRVKVRKPNPRSGERGYAECPITRRKEAPLRLTRQTSIPRKNPHEESIH